MNRLDTARRYSLFLARNLDSGKLKPEIFLPMLDKVLTEADFQAFADWDQNPRGRKRGRIGAAVARVAPLCGVADYRARYKPHQRFERSDPHDYAVC